MIEYILVAVLQMDRTQFDISSRYTTFTRCHEAREDLKDLRGITVVVSACVKVEIK